MSLQNVDIKENEKIDEDFKAIGNLLTWQKYFLTIGGLWPMEKTYIRASVWTGYLGLHLIMEYTELFTLFGNFNSLVISVLESTMQSMVFTKLIVFRHSKTLCTLLEAMKEDFSGNMYGNHEEKRLYLKFHDLSKWYYKLSVPYIMCGASMYYSRPLLTSLLTGGFGTNNSMFFPFQIKLPYAVLDMQTYFMTYAYLSPMVYLLACQNAWICLLITTQLHICGQLSIVEHRIRTMPYANDDQERNMIFKSVVDLHTRSIWMAKSFDDSFHFVLLVDLVVMTLMLGLMSYIVIIGGEMEESAIGPLYTFCGLATLGLIYGYCIVGEALISESSKIYTAYAECMWYEASASFRKGVMICLLESQEPLRMTAGKFFVFSLPGFTNILKTAMGYLSMLRKVTE
ncbi:odorant receptor 13a [Diachasma alloeum]|uniref:Odorant receptor n=1 Tax=Diachasma alloeum TaxID=454923 RepID=A0A4E0S3W4_9HYME|nr:odorant receptor 13a [Diachasma alloeum]THK33205.1 odorant receptor 200 [Diachasma alloeum]